MFKSVRLFMRAFALGSAAMYLLDPELGERRRASIRNQFSTLQSEIAEMFERGGHGLQAEHRAHEMESEIRSELGGISSETTQSYQIETGRDDLHSSGTLSPAPRLLAIGGAVLLLGSGLRRGGLMGTVRRYAGAGLMMRALVNRPLNQLLGFSRRQGAVEIWKSIAIDAPLEDVFALWCNYSNFPRFMANVLGIEDLGNGRSHWRVRGPAGSTIEWYAHIIRSIPERMIAWETEPGSLIYQNGMVRFTRNLDGHTVVDVHMSYSPPVGVVGHAVANVFGTNPKKQIDEDLARLKSLFEQGRTTARGKTVTREEIMGGLDEQCLVGDLSGRYHNGGGKGRRRSESSGEGRVDVIGGETGVYPASGPLPPGDADLRGMASWGQGERGAAGYEDSSESKIGFHDEERKESDGDLPLFD